MFVYWACFCCSFSLLALRLTAAIILFVFIICSNVIYWPFDLFCGRHFDFGQNETFTLDNHKMLMCIHLHTRRFFLFRFASLFFLRACCIAACVYKLSHKHSVKLFMIFKLFKIVSRDIKYFAAEIGHYIGISCVIDFCLSTHFFFIWNFNGRMFISKFLVQALMPISVCVCAIWPRKRQSKKKVETLINWSIDRTCNKYVRIFCCYFMLVGLFFFAENPF